MLTYLRPVYFVVAFVISLSAYADPPKPKYGPANAPRAVPLSRSNDYFRSAEHPSPDFWALMPYYLDQHTGASCSVASVAMLVNAVRRNTNLTSDDKLVTQADLLRRVTAENWSRRVGPRGHGVNLDQLGRLIQASLLNYGVTGASVAVVHTSDASSATLERLRRDLIENETSGMNFIVINFNQAAFTDDAEVGHIAPLAAYDQATRKVLVLDPDREWYEPYWVSDTDLLAGMATRDSAGAAFRGYIKIQIPASR